MAVDLGILEKLRELKERFSGPDAHADAMRQIQEWEARVQKLSSDQEFFNHAATQELYGLLKERIKTHIRSRLQKGKTPEDFKMADARQEEIKWVLGLFNPNYESELASLESLIDGEL